MLKITKKGDKYWLFEDSQIGLFSPSKFTINLELNEIVIVYENGLKSKRYNVIDCEIYDLGATSPFTTSSGNAFMEELENLNCPCFQKNENIYNISGGEWGDITGTLSDQTDLKNALDSKLDKVSTAGVERAYIVNADGSQGTKPTSDLGGHTSDLGGQPYNPSFWISDKLTKTASVYFVNAALNAGNFFGGSAPNTSSFKTMLGIGIMSGTNANGGGRYKNEAPYAIRPTPGLSFYSCFNLANTTRDNFIKIGFFNNNDNISSVSDGFWLQINGVNATLNTANGGVNSQSSSSALTTTYMECLVEYISSTEVKCKVKQLLTGNVVFNQTLTTNIPTAAKIFGGGLIATITTAGASDSICSIQELAFGIKPEFLNNF